MKFMRSTAFAFAPASIGNLGIGFDILGLCLSELGDIVKVKLRKDRQIIITHHEKSIAMTPESPSKNVCSVAIQSLMSSLSDTQGFDIEISKGIPLSSGLGGSAASSVAALIAVNSMLEHPLSKEEILPHALEGEKIASGSSHLDNIAPSLYGGLCLCTNDPCRKIQKIPFPEHITCVLLHQNIKINTKDSRNQLSKTVPLKKFVNQSSNIAGFISACYENNISLLKASLNDVVIEPQRKENIPYFDKLKEIAIASENTIGFSISGSGPSVFALSNSFENALHLKFELDKTAQQLSLDFRTWVLKVDKSGSKVIFDKDSNEI